MVGVKLPTFLHLTLQEFFAAYYVSQLSKDAAIKLFYLYGQNKGWSVVWRFVAGITKFEYFEEYAKAFCSLNKEHIFNVSKFFIQCLFEAQTQHNLKSTIGAKGCVVSFDNTDATQLDKYALGYCIAHNSTKVYWDVSFSLRTDMSIQSSPLFPLRLDSLSSGLKTEPLTGGVFRRLNIVGCAFNFAELRVCPLQHISVLR